MLVLLCCQYSSIWLREGPPLRVDFPPVQADNYYNRNDTRVVALNPQSTTGSYPPYQTFLPLGTGIDDFIYATALQGPVSYSIPVPNGQYAVDLQFAEIEPGVGSGVRVFNINLQGVLAGGLVEFVGLGFQGSRAQNPKQSSNSVPFDWHSLLLEIGIRCWSRL